QILQARVQERVGMGAMAVMAHQRAPRALRMVVIPALVSVIHEQEAPAAERATERLDPPWKIRADFGPVAFRQRLRQPPFEGGDRVAQCRLGRPLRPLETSVVAAPDTERERASAALDEDGRR